MNGQDRPLRIGIVCYPTYGGSGAVATELGRLLARRGHIIHFISYSRPFRLESDFHENIFHHEINNESYPLFQGQLYTISAAVKIQEIIRQEGLDILHLHYALPHAISAWLAMEMLPPDKRVPVVTTLHGTDVTLVGSRPSFFPAVQLGLDRSDQMTSVSMWLADQTCRLFRVCDNIEVVYNFVDTEIFQRRETSCHRKCFASCDEKVLIHISNFRPVKRVGDVIRIFAQVAAQVPSRLLMVGDGPDRELAQTLAEQLGVADRVLMLGKQPDVQGLLSIADLLLFPSDTESFGLVPLEAMACELPTVGSRTGGLPEVIVHNQTGLLYPVGDVDTMAQGAIALLRDDERRREMGRAGRQRAIEHFEASKIIPRYEALYRRLLCPAGVV